MRRLMASLSALAFDSAIYHVVGTTCRNPFPSTISSAESAAPPMLSSADVRDRDGRNLMPASSRPIANLQGLAPTRDSDPAETSDWLDSLESMFRHSGPERAEFILSALEHKGRELGVFSVVL